MRRQYPQRSPTLPAGLDPGSNIHVNYDRPEGWGYLVSAYSRRLLSVEDDKLLGKAALAEAYRKSKSPGDYLAGMWRQDFLQQSLWVTDLYAVWGGLAWHPATYRAPSWSWASFDGHISCFGVSANGEGWWMMPETMGPIFTCEVVDDRTTLVAAGNTFGMFSDGYLMVQGKLRQVVWQQSGAHENDRDSNDSLGRDMRMIFKIDCPQDWEGA